MSTYPSPFDRSRSYPVDYQGRAVSPQVIARFFNSVYAWMAAGLALTAFVAYWVSTRADILANLGGGVFIGLFIAQIILVVTISAAVRRVGPAMATVLFLIYAALNGVTLSGIFLVYAHSTLASAFAITAGMFGVMSLYGFFTQRDLSAWGSLLFMGLVGIILASIVSIFWHNSMLNVAINYIGVLIFVGLTAYDTQMLKQIAVQTAGEATLAARLSISGALMLYLDFLNLFLFLLRSLSDRR
ncbi:MAG TPA: Bax inhibitor-1/YccA family protein [Tepidisphaeraceae bacterium]|nr:Bax inhibitor-1/YccA family protein [Tepidisphaeraceae bacterium]